MRLLAIASAAHRDRASQAVARRLDGGGRGCRASELLARYQPVTVLDSDREVSADRRSSDFLADADLERLGADGGCTRRRAPPAGLPVNGKGWRLDHRVCSPAGRACRGQLLCSGADAAANVVYGRHEVQRRRRSCSNTGYFYDRQLLEPQYPPGGSRLAGARRRLGGRHGRPRCGAEPVEAALQPALHRRAACVERACRGRAATPSGGLRGDGVAREPVRARCPRRSRSSATRTEAVSFFAANNVTAVSTSPIPAACSGPGDRRSSSSDRQRAALGAVPGDVGRDQYVRRRSAQFGTQSSALRRSAAMPRPSGTDPARSDRRLPVG